MSRNSAYLGYIARAGDHPRIAELLATGPPGGNPRDQFDDVLARILTGVLS